MIRTFASAILALSTLFATHPAAAKDLALEPSSPWVMDYAADSCALRRMFGTGEKRVQMELRRFAPGSSVLVSVSTNATPPTHQAFQFRFEPQKKWRDAGGVYADFDDFKGVIFDDDLAPEGPDIDSSDKYSEASGHEQARRNDDDAAAGILGLDVRRAFGQAVILHSGSLSAPWAAMDKCLDELVTHWGVDAQAQKTLTRHAWPTNLRTIGRMMDYPPKMLAKGMPGVVNVRLAIDEKGDITGCFIQMPLSDPAFEKSTCADLEHSLDFQPALDKDGHPIKSYWTTLVNFRLR